MAKGIEETLNQQFQQLPKGFKSMKKKFSGRILKCGLALSLLSGFFMPKQAAAETILNETYDIKFRVPNAIYGKSQNPTTRIKVKVDCDKIADREYELKLSFFSNGWNEEKGQIEEYVLVDNSLSSYCLIYPEDSTMIGEIKESAYLLSRKSFRDEKMAGRWEKIKSLKNSPKIKKRIGVIMGASTIATSVFNGGKLMGLAGYISTLFEKDKSKQYEGCTVFEVPFYPAGRETSARKFTIPLGIRANTKNPRLGLLLNITLRRGLYSKGLEYGKLENLLVDVPIGQKISDAQIREYIERDTGKLDELKIVRGDLDNDGKKEILAHSKKLKLTHHAPHTSWSTIYDLKCKFFFLEEINGKLSTKYNIDTRAGMGSDNADPFLYIHDFNRDGLKDILLFQERYSYPRGCAESLNFCILNYTGGKLRKIYEENISENAAPGRYKLASELRELLDKKNYKAASEILEGLSGGW